MRTIQELQKEIYQNKLDKNFNVTDVTKEFVLLYGEVGEAYQAWCRKPEAVGEELADVMIYLLGLAEILGLDMQSEIERKVDINHRREYAVVDGIFKRVKEG